MKKRILAMVVAIVMGVTCLISCGTNKAENETKTVTWYLPGIIEGDKKDVVMEKINIELKEKYDMQLDLVAIDMGNFSKKMQVINSGGENYDLSFTSNWLNNYYSNVSKGAFIDITELLPEAAPNLYKSMSQHIWDATKVDGKVYAVPNWQVQAKAFGVYIPKDKLEKTGMSLDSFNSIEDMTSFLRELVKHEPESIKIDGLWQSVAGSKGMLEIVETSVPGVVYYNKEGKPVVINQFETKEFEDYVKLRKSWVEEGIAFGKYIPQSKAIEKEVQQMPFTIQTVKPGGINEFNNARGYEWVEKQISPAILGTDGVIAAMTAVSRTSEDVDAALKMLEIINSDKNIYNMIAFGLENENYNKISDNQIKLIPNSGYSGISNWEFGSVMNSYTIEGQPEDIWQQTKAFNDGAMVSPTLGFSPVVDNISTQISNCKAVVSEQLTMLDLGLFDGEESLTKFRTDLKKAGADEIIAELQRQLDEWYEK